MAELWAELVEKTVICRARVSPTRKMEDTRQIVGGKIEDGTKTAKRAG